MLLLRLFMVLSWVGLVMADSCWIIYNYFVFVLLLLSLLLSMIVLVLLCGLHYFLTLLTELYSEQSSPFILFLLFFPKCCLCTLSASLMRGRSVSALMGIELVLFSAYMDFFLAYYSNSNAVFNRLLKLSNEVFGLNIPDRILVFLTVFPCCLISTTFNSYNIFLRIYYSSFFVLSLLAYCYAGSVYF